MGLENRIRGRIKIGGAFAALAILTLSPMPAQAVRAVPWVPGRPVVVNLKPALTTEILFPERISTFNNPDPRLLSMSVYEARLLVKPLMGIPMLRVFAYDAQGRSYIVELHETVEGQKEDDSVEIVPELAPMPFAPVGRGRKDLIRALFIAMKQERPLGGFEVFEKKREIFYQEPGVMTMRLLKRYDSNVLIGYIVEAENDSSGPIRVDPQQFPFKGYIAGSVTDMQLAPHEPENSVEAFKGLPKKTLAYIVVSREGQ